MPKKVQYEELGTPVLEGLLTVQRNTQRVKYQAFCTLQNLGSHRVAPGTGTTQGLFLCRFSRSIYFAQSRKCIARSGSFPLIVNVKPRDLEALLTRADSFHGGGERHAVHPPRHRLEMSRSQNVVPVAAGTTPSAPSLPVVRRRTCSESARHRQPLHQLEKCRKVSDCRGLVRSKGIVTFARECFTARFEALGANVQQQIRTLQNVLHRINISIFIVSYSSLLVVPILFSSYSYCTAGRGYFRFGFIFMSHAYRTTVCRYMRAWSSHYSRVWINRVRLPILPVVS